MSVCAWNVWRVKRTGELLTCMTSCNMYDTVFLHSCTSLAHFVVSLWCWCPGWTPWLLYDDLLYVYDIKDWYTISYIGLGICCQFCKCLFMYHIQALSRRRSCIHFKGYRSYTAPWNLDNYCSDRIKKRPLQNNRPLRPLNRSLTVLLIHTISIGCIR